MDPFKCQPVCSQPVIKQTLGCLHEHLGILIIWVLTQCAATERSVGDKAGAVHLMHVAQKPKGIQRPCYTDDQVDDSPWPAQEGEGLHQQSSIGRLRAVTLCAPIAVPSKPTLPDR